MGRIPEETVEQVIEATDIVDLIGSYLPLKRVGSSFKANCPFHNEKTPSFHVNPQRQSFHCFGCSEGGNAIGFLMAYENLPFLDAVKKLATRAGVPIQEEAYDPNVDKRRKLLSTLKEVHNKTAQFMHEMLMKSPHAQHARDYLKSRGYGHEMAKRWKVGWMPDNPDAFLNWAREQKIKGKELINCDLAGRKNEYNPNAGLYVRFRNRLMFPIHNDYGDIIAFSGRQLAEDKNSGKYINSRETQLFKKSKTFFALDKARRAMTKDKFALLCEGQIDVIACHENGIECAIATLGTACTPDHARMLKRYTRDVIICYDADDAGFKAADKAFQILSAEDLNIKMVLMPQGEDPDSLIKKNGADGFRELVTSARDYFDVKLELETKKRDLSSVNERVSLAGDLSNLVAHVSNKIAKDSLINQISTRLSIGVEELRSNVVEAEKNLKRAAFYSNKHQAKQTQEEEATVQKAAPTPLDSCIGHLCHFALTSQEAQDWLGEQLESIIEPLNSLPGGHVLRNILSRRPNPTKPASIQSYFSTLPEEDQLALSPILYQTSPPDPVRAAEETINMLVSTHFQKKDASLRARLQQPNLAADEMVDLLKQVEDLQGILKNLQQRFIR